MLDSETADEWVVPDQESLHQIALAVDRDLAQGVGKDSIVDELVTEEGWPKEAAVSFVDQIEREGRGRRRLRKTPRLPRGRAAPMADAPFEDHIDWYEDEGFQVVSLTDTTAELVRPEQFSTFWALLSSLPGVGLVFQLIFHLSGMKITVHLAVQPDGTVRRR